MKITDLTPDHYGRTIRVRATSSSTVGVLTYMRTATTRYEEPMLAGSTYYDETWVTLCVDGVWIEPLKGRVVSFELLD